MTLILGLLLAGSWISIGLLARAVTRMVDANEKLRERLTILAALYDDAETQCERLLALIDDKELPHHHA